MVPSVEEPLHPKISCEVKAFGKDGVRLFWTCESQDHFPLALFYSVSGAEEDWQKHCLIEAAQQPEEGNLTGVHVVRELPSSDGRPSNIQLAPRNVWWRCYSDSEGWSAPSALSRQTQRTERAVEAPIEVDEEMAFNIIQWYGTAIFDLRPEQNPACDAELSAGKTMSENEKQQNSGCVLFGKKTMLESVRLPPGSLAPLSRPYKDNALLLGNSWSPDQLNSISTRIVGKLFCLPRPEHLFEQFPFLAADIPGHRPSSGRGTSPPPSPATTATITTATTTPAAATTATTTAATSVDRLPVLPNLIKPRLFLGHQGHALTVNRWRPLLKITHVVNLAENRVSNEGEGIVYLRAPSGCQLMDVSSEVDAFKQVALELLPLIESALSDGASLLIHCQQGRSRSCALVVAHLVLNLKMGLLEALTLVAARRPEMEINEGYLQALIDLSSEPDITVEAVVSAHPRWVRCGGVARQHRERDDE